MAYPIDSEEGGLRPERSQARQFVAMLVIGVATALVLGVTVRSPTQLEANDISRWCTVWSLLERGTYAIDESPWQARTQDKVRKADKLAEPGNGASALTRFEYAIAPRSWKTGPVTERFYSSKPPLLPTVIAGALYPFRKATGVPLEKEVLTDRSPRYVQKIDPANPSRFTYVLETPKDKIKWPVYVFYFKPIVILLNVLPMFVFLILYSRFLDRYAVNDWSWMASLFAAAFGTLLFAFDQTLNNHTVAAYSAFFALYPFLKIWDDDSPTRANFLAAGFFAAFTACNELPAALFGLLLFLVLLARWPGKTLKYFVPAAVIPCLAFLITQYAAMGQFKPAYEDFGTKAYEYEGSYWTTPLEFDYFNKAPESKSVYLLHMLIGHHGVFSLTPIALFAIIGAFRAMRRESKGLAATAALTLVLTIAMVAFYDWNPKARNYGGSTQGLRWLFWLIPFWMITLPPGLEPGQDRRVYRWLSLIALMVSVFSVGYAIRHPWSHPWIVDLMEQLGLYSLKR
ncbi:MAG: hypothetical protein JWN86_375 [Planctomycetota bacterium]|nr:hypothetical protein [Planctomycetota bacterium]